MRAYILDIETCPLPEAQLLALMPPEVANPVMPEAIKNPPPVDLSKCPLYGGSVEKQEAWKATKQLQWETDARAAREIWEEKAIEAKQRFIDDAALSPFTGTVKLIGIKDVEKQTAYIFVCDPTEEEMVKLNNGKYPCKINFLTFVSEEAMLGGFSTGVNSGAVIPGASDLSSDFKLIGFYTENFDYPFIFKRCWITGVVAPWSLRKKRYWNEDISTDLYNVFTFYDRSVKTNGLNGVAKVLGTKQKSGTGEHFYRLWESDPVAAVLYLIDDLGCVEEAATKMGVIRPVKGAK